MKSLSLSPVLFGVDLRLVGKDWLRALQLMANWPVLRWLTPEFPTRLQTAAGQVFHCTEKAGGSTAQLGQFKTSFSGVVLPADLMLWHTLSLPSLNSSDRKAAIELEVQRLNPFDPAQLVWTSVVQTTDQDEQQTVALGLTSRALIEQHLVSHAPSAGQAKAQAGASEVWVQLPRGDLYVPLPGFGETGRQRSRSLWRSVNLVLLALCVLVGLAAAVTPSLQLRERAREAAESFGTLQSQSAKAMQARQQMTELNDKVAQLQKLIGQRMVPEYMLLLITRYVPDDTYLLSLDIKGNNIAMTGTTPKATALVQHLSRQPGVRSVVSRQPARREANRDYFQIEWILEPVLETPPEGAAQPASAPVAAAPAVPASAAASAPAVAASAPAAAPSVAASSNKPAR